MPSIAGSAFSVSTSDRISSSDADAGKCDERRAHPLVGRRLELAVDVDLRVGLVADQDDAQPGCRPARAGEGRRTRATARVLI